MSGITRPMSQMRKIESKEALFRARKRILKYLVLGFLKQEGFLQSAETLASEANLTGEYQLCDNIDLDIILQDYCSYYLIRFNKQPQFLRQVAEGERPPASALRRPQTRRGPREERRPEPMAVDETAASREKPDLPGTFTVTRLARECRFEPMAVDETAASGEKPDLPGTFTVTRLAREDQLSSSAIPAIERKPLAGLLANQCMEKKEMVELLYQDIVRPSGVSWEDVVGLESAKRLLMESVIYPVRYPEVFTGLLEPWRGVLLHGPPGTGKTLLARAAAAQSCCTFFNVSCSTVVNKWRGESEKIVKVLFEMASYYSPSIIFVDEVETLASDRSSPGEHEASRRLKVQLLTELDGISTRDGVVFLLANSNMPWEIDPAMLRRLEKRIYIPLPDFNTRADLFERFLSSKTIELYPKVDFQELAAKTDGYSGSDIKLVCKEALMSAVRKTLPNLIGKGCQNNRKDRLNLSDILTAIEKTKPVSKNLAKKHEEWQSQMGCS